MSELKKVQELLKPFDRYFNDEVMEFLSQHSIHILTVEPITTGKALEPSFRLFCQNQTYFVKFSSYERFSASFLSELSELNRTGESRLLLPFLSKNIASIKRQLNVYEWIGGNNLKAILGDASSNTIAEYGYRCGGVLQKIHMKIYNEIVISGTNGNNLYGRVYSQKINSTWIWMFLNSIMVTITLKN